jgi:zinc protease
MITAGVIRAVRRAAFGAALALALPALCATPARAAGAYRVPRPVVKKLDNGLRVLVFQDPRLPVVSVELRLPAGASAVGADQSGLAGVTAEMLGRGTTSHSAETFARDFAQIGAGLATDAGREYTTVSSAFLARDFETGVELIEDEFRRAANAVGRDVLQLHQNPPATAVEQLWTLAWPGLPAANPPLGRIETLSRLTLEQVRAFYRERYRPGGSVLAIAGDIAPERAFAVVNDWFGGWPAGDAEAAAAPAPRPKGGARIRIVDRPGVATVALAVGTAVPGRSASDALARSVAASVFEPQFTAHVARGAVRDVRSSVELTRDAGLWCMQAAAPADSVATLARRLEAELKRYLFQAPAPLDVAAAQHRIRRGFPLAFETADGLMGQWLLADFAGFPADYFDDYATRVGALTPQQLQAAARREADPEHPFIVAVGPARKIAPLLQPLGAIETVTLDQPPGAESAPADTLGPRTAAQEAEGRKLVTQALTAHGGRSRFTVIKSSLIDAAVRFHVPGGDVSGTIRTVRKEPDRMVLTTNIKGVETRQVLNGGKAWTVISDGDSSEVDSLDASGLRTTYLSDLYHVLLAASEKDAQVAARGRERVNGKDADKVEVVYGNDPWRMLYFDPTTHRLLAWDQRERDLRGIVTVRRVLGDYRPLEGIQWPYQEERFAGTRPIMNLDITNVELNIDLNDRQFQPPTKGGAPWR